MDTVPMAICADCQPGLSMLPFPTADARQTWITEHVASTGHRLAGIARFAAVLWTPHYR